MCYLQSQDLNLDLNFKTSHLDTLSAHPHVLTCNMLEFDDVLQILFSWSTKSSVGGDSSVIGLIGLLRNENYSM